MMRAASATVALLLCTPLARGAAPSPASLPIVVLRTYAVDADRQGAALTGALRSAVRQSPGWWLSEQDESLEALALYANCALPPDEACGAHLANQLRAQDVMWATLHRRGVHVEGVVHLHTGSQARNVPVSFSANVTEAQDEALMTIAKRVVLSLTEGPPTGTVRIRSDTPGGTLWIDGRNQGTLADTALDVALPGGEHRISLHRAGSEIAVTKAMVRPRTVEQVILVPLQPKDAAPAPWPLRRIGAFSALGAGLVLGAFGVYSSVRVSDVRSDEAFQLYRDGFTSHQDACTEARAGSVSNELGAATPGEAAALCDLADKHTTLQYVLYPLAALALGGGAYLFFSEPETPGATHARLSANVTAGGAAVGLHLLY